MLLRRLADFILQGRLHAMATAFLCVYVSLLVGGVFALFLVGIIGIVIAALVALRKGILDGILVTVAATLPYFLTYTVTHSGSGLWIFGVLIAVASNLLTLIFAIMLRKYETWSLTLDLALVIGVTVVIAIHLFNPDIANWWAAQIMSYVNNSSETVTALKAQVQDSSQDYLAAFTQWVGAIKPFVTGFITVSILLGALMPVLAARWWQASVFNPGGLRKELHQIRLSYLTAFIFVISMALTYLGNATALDIMPILFGIYSLAGLSLLHVILGSLSLSWLWLTLVYIGLMFAPFMAVIIAFVALLDTSVDFRKRLHKF